MKLATLGNDTRDGELVVVSRDLARCVAVPEIARTLQSALDSWHSSAPSLAAIRHSFSARYQMRSTWQRKLANLRQFPGRP